MVAWLVEVTQSLDKPSRGGERKEEWREEGRKGGRGRRDCEWTVMALPTLCHAPSEDSVFHELVVPDARVLEQGEDEVPVPLQVFFC